MQEINSVYFETYGCAANQNNTEIMKGLVRQAGLEITNNKEIADILVINTCVVKGPTEKKIEGRIKELSKLKKPLIVSGCLPEVREGRDYLQMKNIYLLGTHHFKDINKLIKGIQENKNFNKKYLDYRGEEKLIQPKIPYNKLIGITQISEGCMGNCSYCLVRLAKGKLFSYPEDKIIKNIKSDLESGCKEIWITSQDNASYGLEKGKRRLSFLLNKISNINSNFRVRLGMMNPDNILPILKDLISCYKDEKIYKFLHIPVQSGSDKVLREMNRRYNVKEFLRIVKEFREKIPDISLSTDIIVAHPGESDKDFQKSMDLIKKIKPDIFNLSRYWPMKNTPSAKKEQINHKIAKERAVKIMKMHKKLVLDKNKKLIGEQYKCLFNGKDNNHYFARNRNYKPIFLKQDKISDNLIGKFKKVRITGAKGYHLTGEII